MAMTIGSLFSGIGGLELGLERAGVGHTVWQCEIDPFCRQVLAKHWPDAERFEDVKEFEGRPADLICGGFPCQDISSAGKGAGLAGSRSGLWDDFLRIVGTVRPSWVVVENVASGARRWVDSVCSSLGQLSYEALPIALSAQDVGAPHLRRRVFIVAHAQRIELRQQSRRGSRSDWEGSTIIGDYGEARIASNPDKIGRHGWPREGAEQARWGQPEDGHGNANQDSQPTQSIYEEVARMQSLAGDTSAWAAAPEFRRVDDGIPHRVDRLRSLGNAVVPQVAEVVGRLILEML